MTTTDPSSGIRRVLLEVNEEAATFYRTSLLAEVGAGPRRYLTDRGFTALLHDTPWTVGYAPAGWTHLRDHLHHLGLTDQTLLDTGLVSITRDGRMIDRFRDRLTFGIRDLQGGLVGFTARAAPQVPDTVPKYLNTPRTLLYDKSRSLFGLGEHAPHLRDGATPVLVEGPLDAIAIDLTNTDLTNVDLARADRPPGLAPVSPCGTALTDHQARLLSALNNRRIIVAFDRDGPGARATAHAYQVLRDRFGSLKTAELPPGSDPADLLRQAGATGLRTHLANPTDLATRIVDDYLATWPTRDHNAEAKIACLRGAARLVAAMTITDLTHQAARLPGLVHLSQPIVTNELIEATVQLTGRRTRQTAHRQESAIRQGGAARVPGPICTRQP
jgi:DNA primase